MKTVLQVFLIISVLFAKAQITGSLGKEIKTNPVIISSGESNGLGLALMSELSIAEKSVRPNLQILKPTTGVFESLHLGFNQMESYADHVDSAENGIENSLACEVDSGRLNSTIYFMKAGASGARINWYMDSTYVIPGYNAWKVLAARMDSSISQLKVINGSNLKPAMFMVWFQGLNDAAAGTLHWKDSTEKLFTRIRSRWGRVIILMPYLMNDSTINTNPTTSARYAYNADILTMASEVTEFYPINVDGAALKNENHWNNSGFKLIGKRVVDKILEKYKY